MTCYNCNKQADSKLYYKAICDKLNDFELCTDEETRDSDWLEEFYLLLVQIKNAFECRDII